MYVHTRTWFWIKMFFEIVIAIVKLNPSDFVNVIEYVKI